MLDDFTLKNANLGKGITKNRLVRSYVCCTEDNQSYMRNICAKVLSDSNFIQAVIEKTSFFQYIAPISTIHKNRDSFKSNLNTATSL